MANSNPPQAGQWFYIQSKSPDSNGNTQLVTVQGANTSPNSIIQLWTLQPNSYAGLPNNYNGLWQYENGCIVSAIGNQKLVMDASFYEEPNTWVVLNASNGTSSQQWILNDDGTITNQRKTGLVLDIEVGKTQQGQWLNVDMANGSQTQQWSFVYPQVFVPTWSYIQSGLTEDQSNPLVATIQEGTSNVVLSPVQANSSKQLWQITPDGRILSATSGNPVMTLGPQLGGGQNGNYIITAPSPAQTDSSLQWTFNDQNMFINASNGLALNVEGGSANPNTPLITYAVQSGPPENEVWLTRPASTMTHIMAAPPVPFQVFTGDQGTAYTSICQQLGVTDLRSEYPIVDVDLDSHYLDPLENGKVTCPQGVQTTDWNYVVNQLELEINTADDIRLLFGCYNSFHGYLFSDQSNTVGKLITAAGMTQGSDQPNVGGIVLSVFEGVFYTALEAVPGAGAVLGNIMAEGINIGMSVANRGGGSISPDPFQVAANSLQTQLSGNFEALLTAMGSMEQTILTDWGKMQATENAILSTGPDSLAWGSDLTATLETAAMPGYTISAMQMLLPAKYQIFQYQANDDSSLSGPPSTAGSTTQWVQPIGNNTWNKYWIATPGNWTEYPSDEAMQDVWGAGVAESDFFQGLAGWGFARCYPCQLQTPSPNPGVDCNGLVITITNQTPNPLTVNASPNNGQGVTVNGPSSQTLQPYGSVSFIGYYTGEPGTSGGLAIDITITDPNFAGADSVAKFTAHQNYCALAAGDVWVDPPVIGMGYQLTSPIYNSGSFANAYSGTVQIGICLAPINAQGSN